MVENTISAVVNAAKTGKIGDGKVFVYSIEEAIRIRTNETSEKAVLQRNRLDSNSSGREYETRTQELHVGW